MGRIEPTAVEDAEREARWAEPHRPYKKRLMLSKTDSAANWMRVVELNASGELIWNEHLDRTYSPSEDPADG